MLNHIITLLLRIRRLINQVRSQDDDLYNVKKFLFYYSSKDIYSEGVMASPRGISGALRWFSVSVGESSVVNTSPWITV